MRPISQIFIICAALLTPLSEGVAEDAKKAAPDKPVAAANVPKPKSKPVPDDVKTYCDSIFDDARDARFLWQSKTIAKLEKELDSRIALLEERRVEYLAWMKAREEFLAKVEGSLVGIYAKMSADAAALQISEMDVRLAAAIMTKLKPATASSILAEMSVKQAATIAATMSSMGTWNKSKDQGEAEKANESAADSGNKESKS